MGAETPRPAARAGNGQGRGPQPPLSGIAGRAAPPVDPCLSPRRFVLVTLGGQSDASQPAAPTSPDDRLSHAIPGNRGLTRRMVTCSRSYAVGQGARDRSGKRGLALLLFVLLLFRLLGLAAALVLARHCRLRSCGVVRWGARKRHKPRAAAVSPCPSFAQKARPLGTRARSCSPGRIAPSSAPRFAGWLLVVILRCRSGPAREARRLWRCWHAVRPRSSPGGRPGRMPGVRPRAG